MCGSCPLQTLLRWVKQQNVSSARSEFAKLFFCMSLQWMQNPKPLSHIDQFEPWQCDTKHGGSRRPQQTDRSPTERCTKPSVCPVSFRGGMRYLRTCATCPAGEVSCIAKCKIQWLWKSPDVSYLRTVIVHFGSMQNIHGWTIHLAPLIISLLRWRPPSQATRSWSRLHFCRWRSNRDDDEFTVNFACYAAYTSYTILRRFLKNRKLSVWVFFRASWRRASGAYFFVNANSTFDSFHANFRFVLLSLLSTIHKFTFNLTTQRVRM